MLTLIAREIERGEASTFSVLFAAMGLGAVFSMTVVHRLRVRYTPGQLELAGAFSHAIAIGALVISRSQSV